MLCTILYRPGEDTELEQDIVTEKLGSHLNSDFERLKLCSVSDSDHSYVFLVAELTSSPQSWLLDVAAEGCMVL